MRAVHSCNSWLRFATNNEKYNQVSISQSLSCLNSLKQLISYSKFSGTRYIEDIYSFEVNTKYISSNVLKISVISRVHSAGEVADIFNT